MHSQGIGIGPGGSAGRDVTLYRDAADVWRTPDAFHVGELRVDSAGRADSRTQLGLGTVATFNSGVIQGSVPTLSSGGLWAAARIPGLAASKITSGTLSAPSRLGAGTANDTKALYGNGTWKDAGPTLSLTGGDVLTVTQANGDEFSFLITEVDPDAMTSFFDSGVVALNDCRSRGVELHDD